MPANPNMESNQKNEMEQVQWIAEENRKSIRRMNEEIQRLKQRLEHGGVTATRISAEQRNNHSVKR